MANKLKNNTKKSLFVRCTQRESGFPADLLGRINATAEFLQMDRDEFVTELLRQDMEQFEQMQKTAVDWWHSRGATESSHAKLKQHESGKAKIRRSPEPTTESQAASREKSEDAKETKP